MGDIEYFGRAMEALQDAESFLLVTARPNPDEPHAPFSDCFQSSYLPMPYFIDVARVIYKRDGLADGDDE
jgi:hypothetical protein